MRHNDKERKCVAKNNRMKKSFHISHTHMHAHTHTHTYLKCINVTLLIKY